MSGPTVMIVAGDPSGDALAAGLVTALRTRLPGARFIGAGGPEMERAGVRLEFDLTADAVIGVVLKKAPWFWKRLRQLTRLAAREKPEIIVLVDFNFFNGWLARAIRRKADWKPKLVKYVSPQVWASRPGRAEKTARDFDVLLCLFPFEKEWYAKRTPGFRVEWVGHPMFDKYAAARRMEPPADRPLVLLLPGSRRQELRRHLPVMMDAARLIEDKMPARFKMVVPTEELAQMARDFQVAGMPRVEIQSGGLAENLAEATLAIAKTGTVTMECAYFEVPTVTLYKTSFLTYEIGRRIVAVKHLTMANILAGEAVFPEFVQNAATGENIARAALELLADKDRRDAVRAKLRQVIKGLGGIGAKERAAAICAELTVGR